MNCFSICANSEEKSNTLSRRLRGLKSPRISQIKLHFYSCIRGKVISLPSANNITFKILHYSVASVSTFQKMRFLFVIVNLLKLVLFIFFLVININDEGSPGWAFQHIGFFWMMFLIFLPLSFFEKSQFISRGVSYPYQYIALVIVLLNLIPISLGNSITKVYIVTQCLGIALIVLESVLYFKPRVLK